MCTFSAGANVLLFAFGAELDSGSLVLALLGSALLSKLCTDPVERGGDCELLPRVAIVPSDLIGQPDVRFDFDTEVAEARLSMERAVEREKDLREMLPLELLSRH